MARGARAGVELARRGAGSPHPPRRGGPIDGGARGRGRVGARRRNRGEAQGVDQRRLSRAAPRTMIGEVRDELPVSWFADTLVARLASRSGDVLTRQQAEAAINGRGAVLLDHWRALEATGFLLAAAGLVSLGVLLRSPDPRVAHAGLLSGLSLSDGYALFIRGALGFLVLGTGLGLLIPEDSAVDSITGVATVAPILLYALW